MSTSSVASSPSTSMTPAPVESSRATSVTLEVDNKDSNHDVEKEITDLPAVVEEQRYARLTFLLEKSSAYARILKSRMDTVKVAPPPVEDTEQTTKRNRGVKRRKSDESPTHDKQDGVFRQSSLITGAKLRDYQLEGVAWMVSLWENGISGILADEMGLGKTLQTIAFHAHLREMNVSKPFLIVCPLSVLHNWVDEFNKFAPSIPVCMYHGSPENRKELRSTVMRPPEDQEEAHPAPTKKARGRPKKSQPTARRVSGRRSRHDSSSESEEDDDDNYDPKVVQARKPRAQKKKQTQPMTSFPVVVTTYEMIIKDRRFLSQYKWGYIVVDEGHRLKNMDCKLIQEIKRYESAGRMILTGTPLHNNLAELWSLLNFILPDIFHDLSSFQEWFNIPDMQSSLSSERSTHLISTLHSILKPFLLRRLKVDVESSLPPKKEYTLYAPLTEKQRSIYAAVVEGGLHRYLVNGAQKAVEKAEDKQKQAEERERMLIEGRKLREKKYTAIYDVDGDDDEYFSRLEDWEVQRAREREEMMELGRKHQLVNRMKQINNQRLKNTVMQLRKVCSHPFLFDWPDDPATREPVVHDDLVNASGKMIVLERLLVELFKRKHKVLIFSQFTTMLDIIQTWATDHKGWELCRIDGSTKPLERRAEMNRFQTGGYEPDTPHLFLLSTRAGGLGINLTAADTVIFYDQDWNPQMDIQAQDRAHRIGQTKPVLIFRLLSAHTIETKIMERASEKRKLEALVIAKGKFRMPGEAATRGKESLAELAASLLELDAEKIEVVPNTDAGKASVLSDAELDVLLDRSPSVFSDRGTGWTSAQSKVLQKEGKKTAFEVFKGREDEGNDMLANMLGEDVV